MKHTPEQLRIIEAPADNILVSAAAGAGKTAVLTDRIVQRLADGKIDIQQILVMTFTDAAAREMKERIEQKLHEQMLRQSEPSRRQFLSRQLALLPGAAISTIHSFCLRVIRDFVYLLIDNDGQPLLDPNFTVDDGIDAELILQRSLQELFQEKYEEIDALSLEEGGQTADSINAFYRLMDGYGSSRSDQPVLELILRHFSFLRSLPDYQQFIGQRLSELEAAAADFSKSKHAGALCQMLRLRLDRVNMVIDQLEDLLESDIRFIADSQRNQAYQEQYRIILDCLKRLDSCLQADQPDWNTILEIAQPLASLTLPRANRYDTADKKQFMQLFEQYAAEAVNLLSGSCGTDKYRCHFVFDTQPVFVVPAELISTDLTEMLPAVKQFFDLVLRLDQVYTKNKRLAGLIDFSDFEHFALALLRREEVRQYYRTRFTEIYVDEYQDTSSIQETLIQAISQRNCLMVGDLKQSIYRFRHARPQIFKEKAALFRQGEQGVLIELNRNFRSVRGVLEAINGIFLQLMSPGAGEIEYDDSQALVPFRDSAAGNPRPVHLRLLEQAGSPDSVVNPEVDDKEQQADPADSLSQYEKEAMLAVAEIKRLHRQGWRWQDMAILCRTRSMVQTCAAQCSEYDVPVLEGYDTASFDIPELRLIEAWIKLVDNAQQDIPLAAVMRSGLSGEAFSPQELAAVRLAASQDGLKRSFFHQAVRHYGEKGPDQVLRQKTIDFTSWLSCWRDRAIDMRIDDFLAEFLSRTHYLDRLALLTDGRHRIRIIKQLQDLARQYEQYQRRGIHRFARYLENLRENEAMAKFFEHVPIDQDGVRVMTIHGSKGLEFPIVFVVGSRYRLSPRDSKESILISETLGIGMDYVDPQRQIRYPSHLKLAMLAEIKASGLAEELRLFYVALTRAREQLFLLGSVNLNRKNGEVRLGSLISQARQIESIQLPDHLVLSCQSYLEWLVLVLARCQEIDLAFLASDEPDLMNTKAPAQSISAPMWTFSRLSWSELQTELLNQQPQKPNQTDGNSIQDFAPSAADQIISPDALALDHGLPDQFLTEQLRRRIISTYAYSQATRTPIKLAVSELKRREQANEQAENPQEHGFILDNSNPSGAAVLPDLGDLRGINLELQVSDLELVQDATVQHGRLEGSRLGTLLHTVFRYLDLAKARRSADLAFIAAHLEQMNRQGIISGPELSVLLPWSKSIWTFVCSGLAADIISALEMDNRTVYFEMPFTLAVPIEDILAGQAGFAPHDRIMVQGIIDCWFVLNGEITIVDYKSDMITGDDETCAEILRQRYSRQLDWYARAVQAARSEPVSRRLIWHIRRGRSYSC